MFDRMNVLIALFWAPVLFFNVQFLPQLSFCIGSGGYDRVSSIKYQVTQNSKYCLTMQFKSCFIRVNRLSEMKYQL